MLSVQQRRRQGRNDQAYDRDSAKFENLFDHVQLREAECPLIVECGASSTESQSSGNDSTRSRVIFSGVRAHAQTTTRFPSLPFKTTACTFSTFVNVVQRFGVEDDEVGILPIFEGAGTT